MIQDVAEKQGNTDATSMRCSANSDRRIMGPVI